MNTATQASTKVSPAFLKFGSYPEPVKSSCRKCENRQAIVQIEEKQWLKRLKELEELKGFVYKHINDSLDIQKSSFNKGRKNVHYYVGNKLLKKTHVLSVTV